MEMEEKKRISADILELEEAKNEITERYHQEYLQAKVGTLSGRNGKGRKKHKCENNLYNKVFEEVKEKRNLPSSFSFSCSAVMKRIKRDSTKVYKKDKA